jgi:fucose permease
MPDRCRRHRVFVSLLYASFALAGFGCALPGALLPALLREWRLQDQGAGALFLVIAAGSAVGALLLVRRLLDSLLFALGLLALAAWFIARASSAILLTGLCWGLALGMLMTGISLLRQRDASQKGVELVRLNLLWALGACLCPVLVAHALRTGSPRGVMQLVALVSMALAAGLWLCRPEISSGDRGNASVVGGASLLRLGVGGVPAALILATVLSTGVEASGGAWLATYAERSRGGLAMVVGAPTCLWGGLLLSRGLGSLRGAAPWLGRSLRPMLLLVAAASVGLLVQTPLALLLSAFALGFGLGPLYPTLLARTLAYRQNGLIFCLCGIASSVMPWLTGVLSTHFVSLRAGLLVLTAGALVLLFAGFRLMASADEPRVAP